MEGEEAEAVVGEDVVLRMEVKKNPYTSVRKALDSEDYDMARAILYSSEEGILENSSQT